jgi:hypothetical protein
MQQGRQSGSIAPDIRLRRNMSHRIHFAASLIVIVACVLYFGKSVIADLMTFPPGRPLDKIVFIGTVLTPIAGPASPIPAILERFVPSMLVLAGVIAQTALGCRRLAICLKRRELVESRDQRPVLAVLLKVGVVSWSIAALVTLAPAKLFGLAPTLGMGLVLAQAFVMPVVWVLVNSVLGPAFFLSEVRSMRAHAEDAS